MTRTIVIIVRNICWELYWLFKAENITIIMTSKKLNLLLIFRVDLHAYRLTRDQLTAYTKQANGEEL